jgi:hypothetical protein
VDGYLTKPFTAASLSKIIVSALKSKLPEEYAQVKHKTPMRNPKDNGPKIFGESAPSSSAKSWSITPRSLSQKNVIKGVHVVLLTIMSPQFDMMESLSDFVDIRDITKIAQDACQNMDRQSEDASRIVDISSDMNRTLDAIEKARIDSQEAKQGLRALDQSATALGALLDAFDHDVAEVTAMLGNMESMVRQVHIIEMNELLKESYALEAGREVETARKGDADTAAEETAERLSVVRSESEVTCKTMAQAAENINQALERISSPDMPATPLRETFKQLNSRIDHIMQMLDNQLALASIVTTGIQEAATAPQKAVQPDKPEQPPSLQSKPDYIAKSEKTVEHSSEMPLATPSALRKILDNRILMMDIIRKEHSLTITGLTELLFDKTELLPEQVPGSPASSLSKWIDHNIEREDIFYDPDKCKQLAGLRDDMHLHAVKTVELLPKGRKIEALKNFQKVKEISGRIDKLLEEMREGLKNRIN